MLTATQTRNQRKALRYFSSDDLVDAGVRFHPGIIQQSVEAALSDMGQGIA